MQKFRVIGTTPTNRENYIVLGEHQKDSLLEFTLTGYEIFSVVISIGGGEHVHVMAREAITYLLSGRKIHGLTISEGNKLALSSTFGKRQIERRCFEANSIYSCCIDMYEPLLVGVFIETYQDKVNGMPMASSYVTGYRFCLTQEILDFTPEEAVTWLKNVYVPELSVVNGNIYINDWSIISRIQDMNAQVCTGSNYIELVAPEDIVYVKSLKERS